MSYIRSTTNPEGLYIYSDGEYTYIHEDTIDHPNVDSNEFDELLKKAYYSEDDEITSGNFRVREVFKDGNIKIQLSYHNTEIHMWYCTWRYLVESNAFRYKKKIRNRFKIF